MNVVVLVLSIMVAVALIQAAIWIPLARRWRRRTRTFWDQFHAEVTMTGERIVIPAQSAVYRGGTGPFSAVDGNGEIALTDRRLVFCKKTGGTVEVSVANIVGTRESKVFRGSRVGGATHFIVATADPAEIGFFVTDQAAWTTAIDSVRTR